MTNFQKTDFLKYENHIHEPIAFERSFINDDLIGAGDEIFPMNDDKVVAITTCHFSLAQMTGPTLLFETTFDPTIMCHISNWKEIENSPMMDDGGEILIFKATVSDGDIIKCVQAYAAKYSSEEERDHMLQQYPHLRQKVESTLEKLKKVFTVNVSDYKDQIVFDFDNMTIENFKPRTS